MTVQHLREALARQAPQKGVVVSEPLFLELCEAGEIRAETLKFPLPTDDLARRIGELLGEEPATEIDYEVCTLQQHGGALVVRDIECAIRLADSGPGSFEIR